MPDSSETDARLASIPLFSGLSRRQRGKLVDGSRTVSHEAGKEVTVEGLGSLAMHLVLEGAAEVSIRGEHVRDLGPGDYFGEISLIDGKPRSATVRASGPLTTLAVPHHVFNQVLDDDPTAARSVLTGLCARLREAESPRA